MMYPVHNAGILARADGKKTAHSLSLSFTLSVTLFSLLPFLTYEQDNNKHVRQK